MKRIACVSAILFFTGVGAIAGTITFDGKTDKSKAVYGPGEKMLFSVQALDDGKPAGGLKLKWTRTGDDQRRLEGEAESSAEKPFIIETSLDSPGFVRIEVVPLGENGKPIVNADNSKPAKFEGGAGVLLDKIESYPEPADFDAFWKKQKERLAAVPMKVLERVEVKSVNPRFNVFDVKVACAGKRPVSGYLSIPKDAKDKSLPAAVVYLGYGVVGRGAYQEFRNGTMTFLVNAHGIENGKDPDYYKQLAEGELKNYAFSNAENADPETCYFNGMALRLMRSMEFVKSLPEWNGKDLTVAGGSQGGFQALLAAGLDKDVTKCEASRPWCCDLGGVKMKRLAGWRPDWTEALGYYDAANHAKRIKCETLIEAGLGDYVCPPSGMVALYNNIKASKKLTFSQGRVHGYVMPNCQTFTMSSK